MKKMKRFIAIAAAIAVLAVSGTLPAFADTETTNSPAVQDQSNNVMKMGSLTMQDQNGQQKKLTSYSAYQIATFDADTLNGKTVFTNIKMNPANGDTYREAIRKNITVPSGPLTDYDLFLALSKIKDNAQEAINLADALAAAVAGKPTIYNSYQGQFKNLPYGYYLVLETDNKANDGTVLCIPMLVCVPDSGNGNRDVCVKVKTPYATIEKKIEETDTQNKTIYVDTNTTSINKPVKYQSLSTFPVYSNDVKGINYTVTDTLSKGLTFDNSIHLTASIVKVNADATTIVQPLTPADYSLTWLSGADNSSGFKLTLINKDKDEKIKEWAKNSDQLRITYAATLNKDAKTGKEGNPNSVELTYSIKPGCQKYDLTTKPDTVITYTYELVITKRDGNFQCQTLAGAEFTLSKDDGLMKPIQMKTDGDGKASVTGLDQGNYTLVETKAPQGYNLPGDPIKFTLTAYNENGPKIPDGNFVVSARGNDDASNVHAKWVISSQSTLFQIFPCCSENVAILNYPGFVLPGTGGIGTVIFTVGGIAILLVGGCMAFLYYRKKKKSERQ